MDEKYIRRHKNELKGNRAKIIPICIVVDTSYSMKRFHDAQNRTRIERLNEGIREFLSEIRDTPKLADAAEIAIVTFNTNASVYLEFSTIENIGEINIAATGHSGDTPKGVDMALNMLKREKAFLEENGNRCKTPWLIVMSDGRATPAKNPETGEKDFDEIGRRLRAVQRRTRDLESQERLTVIPVLISEPTDGEYPKAKKQMQGFTKDNRCKEIGNGADQISFKEFFRTLSQSVSVSNANLMFAVNRDESKPVITPVLRDAVKKPEKQAPTASPVFTSHGDAVRGNPSGFVLSHGDMVRAGASDIAFAHGDVVKTEEKKKKKEPPPPVVERDNVEEVERLKKEAARAAAAPKKKTAPAPVIKVEQEPIPEPICTVTRSTKTDDAYLESLLAGLGDWDNI